MLLKMFKNTFLIVLSFLLFACSGDDYNQDVLKPESRKNMGELLVVLDKKFWDNSKISYAIKSNFGQLVTSTPLPYEPEFDVEFVDQGGVNKMIKRHKTILIVNIDPFSKNNSKEMPTPIFDLWAKNQIVYKINATSQKNAVTIINHYTDSIKLGINQFYYANILAFNGENKKANTILKKNHSIKLKLPSNMLIKKSTANFTWLNRTEIKKDNNGDHEIQQGIFVYSYPYINENLFSIEQQITFRDSLLKKHVHGSVANSYMITRKDELANNQAQAQLIKNKYVFSVRGLWRVENDKMGGPFISISTLSEDEKNIITIEGYVYAPNFEKRELLKELEAVIHSFEFTH